MRYHVCLDVRGALKNWNKRQLGGLLRHNDGRRMNASEAKDALMGELAHGHLVIPYQKCDNFDYKEGCQGHPDEGPSGAPGKAEAEAQEQSASMNRPRAD